MGKIDTKSPQPVHILGAICGGGLSLFQEVNVVFNASASIESAKRQKAKLTAAISV